MAIRNYSGGGGAATAGNRMVAHDEDLSGGATWHWPLNGDGLESVVGGGALDLTGTKTYQSMGPGEDDVQVLDATNSTLMDTGAIGAAIRIQTAITVAAWIRRDGAITGNLAICGVRIAGAGETNNIQWELGMDTSERVRFTWQDGAADNQNIGLASAPSVIDVWEHWTFTRPTAGTSGKLYKNGVFDSETTGLNKATGGGSISDITVGHSKGGAEFTGLISSVIVFETEMDAAAVSALYESSLEPATTSVDSVVHVPLTGAETDALVVYPGATDTDIGASNFVLDLDTAVHIVGGGYNGQDVFDVSTTQLLGTTEGVASGASFQIPTATGVTFGGMFYLTALESTPYLLSQSTAATNINFALVGVAGVINYQTSAGIDVVSGFEIPTNCWFHICAVSQPNRLVTQVYKNGVAIGGSLTTAATAPHADSELYIGTVNAVNGDCVGQVSDIFIADAAYSAAQVRTLAENAFGHPLP